jgi:hypothetical protein
MDDNICAYCSRPLIDCAVPADLCDRLNLTVAVGNFTIQEEAIAYKCICGKTSLCRLQSTIAYHTFEERNVERPNTERGWETSQNIEMGWEDKSDCYEGWSPRKEEKHDH